MKNFFQRKNVKKKGKKNLPTLTHQTQKTRTAHRPSEKAWGNDNNNKLGSQKIRKKNIEFQQLTKIKKCC